MESGRKGKAGKRQKYEHPHDKEQYSMHGEGSKEGEGAGSIGKKGEKIKDKKHSPGLFRRMKFIFQEGLLAKERTSQ